MATLTGLRRHVVLVGLSGAGKTTVGKLAAAALGAPFLDLDQAIERRAGKRISRIFADDGEATFRKLERGEMDAALSSAPCVIAAGGGWAAQPGNLEAASGRALTVYLRVVPEVAAARLALTTDNRQLIAENRPLLAGDDPAARLRELLAARRSFYQQCEATTPADLDDADAVAREVVNLARSLAGWY